MTPFIKNFLDWFHIKPKIEKRKNIPFSIQEGEIYWFYCGENVGAEISGKGESYTRPCLIYRKLSGYLFLVIPLSTKIKEGSWFSYFIFNKIPQIACLHQVKIIDKKRIYEFIGDLDENSFTKIKTDFQKLYI